MTEVALDTLIQLHSPSEARAGMFAIVNSVERGGMLLGLLLAPGIVAVTSPQIAVQTAAGALVLAAAVAAAGLLRTQTLELPTNTAPQTIGAPAGLRSPIPTDTTTIKLPT